LELRIHGIGSHAPPDVDGEPALVKGDSEIGVYVVDDDTRAFVWSRTTRGRLGVYRYFLLPFTLVNVAGYMHRPRGEGSASFPPLVHLIGASVTLSYIFWLLAFAADAPRAYGASEEWQISAFFVVLAAVFGTLVLFAIAPRRRSPPPAEDTSDVGQERFWARYPRRGSYVGHAVLVAVIYEVVNVLTSWRQDVIVSLAAGQLIALTLLGTIVYLHAAGDDQTSEIGGLFALGVAMALPHIAFGGVFYASASIVELFRDIPAGQLSLAVLRPVPYWQFLPTFFTLAGLLWALLLFRRLSDPGPGQSQREGAVRDDYGPSLPEDWVRTVAFKRLRPLIARMPGSLLAQPGKLLAVWLIIGIAGWLGVFTPDTNVATALFRSSSSEPWGYVTLAVSGVAVLAVIAFLQSDRLHQHAAMTFDVLGYWPRRHHVLSPPPYAARVTRELATAPSAGGTRTEALTTVRQAPCSMTNSTSARSSRAAAGWRVQRT